MTDQSVARIVAKTGAEAARARQSLESMSPQNRMMEPEEVAFQVLSLCDPRARGVNGQGLVLDGGAVQS
jgi:NAD(P)-dependent dehydrogenase (short-subunit alcohol dehydrogenase family)